MTNYLSNKMSLFILLLTLTVSSTGCETFTSRVLHRTANDSLVKQCFPKKTKGVPVKLKVPSHVEVSIVETYFMETVKGKQNGADVDVTQIQTLSPNGMNRLLNVEVEQTYTDKVFTVDFPRPLAGTLDLGSERGDGLVFDSESYLKSIRGEITDTTIKDLTEGLGSVQKGASGKSVASSSAVALNGGGQETQAFRRVIAFQRFDIAEPDWEFHMQEFIDQYIGQCNPPCNVNPGCVVAQPSYEVMGAPTGYPVEMVGPQPAGPAVGDAE